MRAIDIQTAIKEEWDLWLAEYVAAVEDGTERAEMSAKIVAKGGHPITDNEWDAALVVSGFCSAWDPILTHPAPRPKTHQP